MTEANNTEKKMNFQIFCIELKDLVYSPDKINGFSLGELHELYIEFKESWYETTKEFAENWLCDYSINSHGVVLKSKIKKL